mmetsp:Transcript_32808/g.96717  ORF Transcript_32808/g.96717 Transcript_32808/m.96717 type:complete len:257 (+) Transcript_32808:230-1000(+)
MLLLQLHKKNPEVPGMVKMPYPIVRDNRLRMRKRSLLQTKEVVLSSFPRPVQLCLAQEKRPPRLQRAIPTLHCSHRDLSREIGVKPKNHKRGTICRPCRLHRPLGILLNHNLVQARTLLHQPKMWRPFRLISIPVILQISATSPYRLFCFIFFGVPSPNSALARPCLRRATHPQPKRRICSFVRVAQSGSDRISSRLTSNLPLSRQSALHHRHHPIYLQVLRENPPFQPIDQRRICSSLCCLWSHPPVKMLSKLIS